MLTVEKNPTTFSNNTWNLAILGDMTAWEALVRHFQPQLMAFLANLLKDRETAYDVCQDCFLSLVRAVRVGRLPHSVDKWLFSTAYRKCINLWEHKHVMQRFEAQAQASFDSNIDESPFDLLIDEENTHIVKLAMQELPPQQLAALSLYFVHEYSYDECAQIMNLSIGAIGAHIHLGKTALRKKLNRFIDS